MRLNENTQLIGENAVLVPKIHVEKYHQWMENPILQLQTASEPLTIEEEYEMQEKWRQDEDKLTFIVCAKVGNTEFQMVGDVNIFSTPKTPIENGKTSLSAEMEIMIAEDAFRRRGIASEALLIMIDYACSELSIDHADLFCRIGKDNASSISLFEKLGFAKVRYSEAFQEWELRAPSQNIFKIPKYQRKPYNSTV